ncbi:hypothetical protein I9W82_000569 [Candida metapsilosis]|uniref:Uncharacterized protein n=1 Tax=Candida metapsilosis TaxID=273372 RepID=A0A8H8DCE9_9ASCO|nr:hypothetical protein I9W82_000569 [Candida metapsilosis]
MITMTEVVNYYASAAYNDHPDRRDKRFGYAGIGLYCPVIPNLNYQYRVSQLEDCGENMQTPLRAKIWSVVKGMEILIDFLKNQSFSDVSFVLICDDLTTVKLILEYGPSYIDRYGNDPSDWVNSKGLPLQDAYLIDRAMDLHSELMYLVDENDLESFELTYRRKDFDASGPSTAWDWAQEAANDEENCAYW